jgi:AraC-like DNA-binding protein
MHKEYLAKEPGWIEMIHSELLRLTAISIRELPNTEKTKSYSAQGSALRKVLEYLGANYSKEITLKTCADQLGFNESYLSSMFKKNTGTSFHQYLINIRLNEAEWMLKDQELSIGEIAERSGFISLKTFHRVFSDKYGTSPGAYRNKDRIIK